MFMSIITNSDHAFPTQSNIHFQSYFCASVPYIMCYSAHHSAVFKVHIHCSYAKCMSIIILIQKLCTNLVTF